jgi:hypothetical protein
VKKLNSGHISYYRGKESDRKSGVGFLVNIELENNKVSFNSDVKYITKVRNEHCTPICCKNDSDDEEVELLYADVKVC